MAHTRSNDDQVCRLVVLARYPVGWYGIFCHFPPGFFGGSNFHSTQFGKAVSSAGILPSLGGSAVGLRVAVDEGGSPKAACACSGVMSRICAGVNPRAVSSVFIFRVIVNGMPSPAG